MFRKLISLFIVVALSWTTVSCGSSSVTQSPNNPTAMSQKAPTKLADGKYPVQQATYNDSNGEYSLFLLSASSGVFRTTDLQMARLTEAQLAAGEKSYLQVQAGKPTLYLTEDFKIEYVHAVTETRPDPQTGQPQTVIVRQESNFWTPFAGALAGQMVGSLLFTPQYYVPPVYQPGGMLVGYGGYGRTYNQAVEHYQTRYQAPPAAEINRRNSFRSTGNINSNSPSTTRSSQPATPANKSSGSGFGTSTLKQSGKADTRPAGSGSFGSGRSSCPARSGFGSRKR